MFKYKMTCHHYAFISVFLWASAYVFTKVILVTFSVGVVGFLRCSVAAVVLGCVLASGKGIRKPPRAVVPRIVMSGLTGLALYLMLLNQGAVTLGPTTQSIVVATTPIFTALLAFLVHRERLRPLRWFAIAMAFGGIVVMTLWDGALDLNTGILWCAAAALSMAVYNILQRHRPAGMNALEMTAHCFFVAAIALAYFLPDAVAELGRAPALHIAIAVYLGAFPSAAAYIAWVKGMEIAPKTSYVANYMFLTPFLSLVMEFAVISQLPDLGTIIGGCIIMASLVLFTMVRDKG